MTALVAKIEQAQKDAERYRWLACDGIGSNDDDADNEADRRVTVYLNTPPWPREALDAAIDAAITQGKR